MATKKPRSKPVKIGPRTPATATSKKTTAARQRARKAVPGGITSDPKIEGVKRAIHEALGRDLADLLRTIGPGDAAGVHAWVPVEPKESSDFVMQYAQKEIPINPVQAAMHELWNAIDEMGAIGDLETSALHEVLGQPMPPVNLASPPADPRLGSSELVARIARAAEAISENNRMRRDRLSRIEL